MKRFATVLFGVLTVAMTVTACGGGNDANDSAASPSGSSTSTPTKDAIAQLTEDANYKEIVALNAKSRTFVGTVADTDAYIAIVDNGAGDITAYVCDSKTVGAWAAGKLSGDAVSATGASGLKVEGTISGSSVTGEVVLPSGGSSAFHATAASAPAGLWQPADLEGKFADLKVGWIVLPDGTQRGLALTSKKELHTVEPVNIASGTAAGAAAASSTGGGPVTTQLTLECKTLQNVYRNSFRAASNSANGTELHTAAVKGMNDAQGFWDKAGCAGDIFSAS
jgi:hypothetical protein